MLFPITENIARTGRHTSFYLACGAADAPLIIFAHGWPELSVSWRHQLPAFAALGFRAIAPDMRGYGRSSVYPKSEDYALEHTVADMIELIDHLGAEKAVWVGHDWGSPVIWSVASHHPERVRAVANLCVPYVPDGFAVDNLVKLVDRSVYPEDQFPAGQWDYMRFYEESLATATAQFEANIPALVKLLFRAGAPGGEASPAGTAQVRKTGGWFGDGAAPDVPIDASVLTEEDFHKYSEALQRNGFFGPDSWYVNGPRNIEFAKKARNGGRLEMPALFLHGAYDYVCYTMAGPLPQPMRAACANLTEVVVHSGHWMAQEMPVSVNAALAKWLAEQCPELWGRS
ncbi:MAG TPA: alpha/beta hydrolase [Caulobacteraceae bacterium]|nr:alpha/beta hydrolase [Caulobacteraceae bacterium]